MKSVKIILSYLFLLVSGFSYGQSNLKNEIKLTLDEVSWWSGVINQGELMPLQNGYSADFNSNYGNQVQPLLISDSGEIIWSEEPLTISVINDTLTVKSKTKSIAYKKAGNTLREAFLYASKTYFPPTGILPEELLFSAPQYNTWIELIYNQNQKDILKYATSIIDNGFPPGVLIIDDNWQEDYGKLDFHPGRFSNPKMMMDSLHTLGFQVMLWVCPFISPDCDVYRDLEARELLLKNSDGRPAIVRWWNGASAELDLSNEESSKWFKEQLDFLQSEYNVDGFKLDAGDFSLYRNVISKEKTTPQEHCEIYARIGLNYSLNEYRAMWKMAGQPLVQRLRDKDHSWRDLQKVIPHILVAGIVGYNFTCPDMVGGGEFTWFLPGAEKLDQEIVVRSAQVGALMPMMQFSVAPWRVLDEKHFDAVKKAVKMREKYTPQIMELARESAITGEPIVRSMEYVFPHQGYSKIDNQFLLGDNILIAPYLEKGEGMREVVIPKGEWKDNNGKIIKGPTKIEIKVKLNEIPIFCKDKI